MVEPVTETVPEGGLSLSERIAAEAASDSETPEAADQTVPDRGFSLSDGLAEAADEVGDDSIDAIRDTAMAALEEARALKDQSFAERFVTGESSDPGSPAGDPFAPSPAASVDYAPSDDPVPTFSFRDDDFEDGEDEFGEPVESRYSRNSAKLPRIGVDAHSSSDTIASLRKQMTAEE